MTSEMCRKMSGRTTETTSEVRVWDCYWNGCCWCADHGEWGQTVSVVVRKSDGTLRADFRRRIDAAIRRANQCGDVTHFEWSLLDEHGDGVEDGVTLA